MAADLPGHGTLLQLKISSTYTTIAQRMELEGPEPELKMRNVTNLDSTSEKKRPAIPDLGKMTGKLFFDPNDSTHQTMRALIYTPPSTPSEWKLIYVDGMTTPANDIFKGYLAKFKVGGMKPDGTLEADFEIEITDTFTPAAGA